MISMPVSFRRSLLLSEMRRGSAGQAWAQQLLQARKLQSLVRLLLRARFELTRPPSHGSSSAHTPPERGRPSCGQLPGHRSQTATGMRSILDIRCRGSSPFAMKQCTLCGVHWVGGRAGGWGCRPPVFSPQGGGDWGEAGWDHGWNGQWARLALAMRWRNEGASSGSGEVGNMRWQQGGGKRRGARRARKARRGRPTHAAS